jgi:hypothetical protein
MSVLLTRVSEEHFIIRKTDIFRYVIFREMPPVAHIFEFFDIVSNTVNVIIYHYQSNNLGSLDKS